MAARDITREEENFFTLFDKAIDAINKGLASDAEIEDSIQKIVAYFREHKGPGSACVNHNFSSPADFLGFFYRYSPLSAGVTRSKILAAIESCEKFKECFNKFSLKVVNVGGGAGSDLVGFYSAISENSTFQDMQVILMDQYSEWKEYFDVVKELLHTGNFGKASVLIKNRKITTSFITADLETAITGDGAEALKEANLVWMKGFLSSLGTDDERNIVTDRIISSMSPGALLVIMDSPVYYRFQSFIQSNRLLEIFRQEEGRYFLSHASAPKYPIATSSNQEIYIFEKI